MLENVSHFLLGPLLPLTPHHEIQDPLEYGHVSCTKNHSTTHAHTDTETASTLLRSAFSDFCWQNRVNITAKSTRQLPKTQELFLPQPSTNTPWVGGCGSKTYKVALLVMDTLNKGHLSITISPVLVCHL